jgi:DNA-binding transcriptional MocR family regulator
MTTPTDPYDWVESWAWPNIERGEMSSLAALVLLRLAAHASRNGNAWPSTRRLAGMVGRSDRAVRGALEHLRDLGLIDGNPVPRKFTRWRLVVDDEEQQRLRELRTTGSQNLRTTPPQIVTNGGKTADPQSADVASAATPHLRTNCEPTADPGSAEGEGEETPLSLPTEAKDARGGEVEFNPRNLIPFRKVDPRKVDAA